MKKLFLLFFLICASLAFAMDDQQATQEEDSLEARLAALAVNPIVQQPTPAPQPDPFDALLEEVLAGNAASAQLTQQLVDETAADDEELALAIAIVKEENRQRSKRIRQRRIPRKDRTNGWGELLNLPLVQLIPLTTDPEEQKALALALSALNLGQDKPKSTRGLTKEFKTLGISTSGVSKQKQR